MYVCEYVCMSVWLGYPLSRRTRSEITRPFNRIIPCTILVKASCNDGTMPKSRTGGIRNTCILLINLNNVTSDDGWW